MRFLFLFLSLAYFQVAAQTMDFEEYDPISTLVVPENPAKRAKFPFVDVHSHQWNVTKERVELLEKEMNEKRRIRREWEG